MGMGENGMYEDIHVSFHSGDCNALALLSSQSTTQGRKTLLTGYLTGFGIEADKFSYRINYSEK